ncbi:hypothetical protein GCG54_00008206 [Colletotrichum gloeosporioides]|uniref:Uncharacterized protein n=1 Tax=Colletotrichum gloeosporioides TaxID=474922 RepID=A0A8H4C7T3_COLGL|nr:uncharacterized protein GCG54_00008206 [Colletotrichum gloeosporioides]KAF3798751.1 hypothetical protein GCG54_00008206 [Colletotrichum gloeosporioides]
MADTASLKALILLTLSQSTTIHFSLETSYGLVLEYQSGKRLCFRLKDSITASHTQLPTQSHSEGLEYEASSGAKPLGGPDSRPDDLSKARLDSVGPGQQPNQSGYRYLIDPDYGTSALCIVQNGLVTPRATFEKWQRLWTEAFKAQECHLGSHKKPFPDLEERKTWFVEGALLAAWLVLQDDVDQVAYDLDDGIFELRRDDLEETLAGMLYDLTDGLNIKEESDSD